MSPLRRPRPERRVGLLVGGVMLLAFLALGMTVVVPATDPDVRDETENVRHYGALEEQGRRIYRSEGCWYCHTQQVRDTPVDDVYGEPLEDGDYAGDEPALLGFERRGPDLTHVGERYENTEELVALLREPRAEGRRSSMPSYDHLSQSELEALAAYLLTLD